MTIYEIINPSDAYTLAAEERAVACAAVLILGAGAYGLDSPDGSPASGCPIFILGGGVEWFAREFGTQLGAFINARRTDIASALDTVLIGGRSSRSTYEKGLSLIEDEGRRQEWREHWHDERRTSINDIGARAWATAKRLREAAA